jgi:formate hydrogenlyase subunit 6/NADH:ubiquinone oxidoreductase subunit I
MGSFVLGGVSFANLFQKPATKMYPVVAITYTDMTKGHVVNDIDTCILCGICAKKCPSLAITVNKEGGTWSIDPFACIQCYSCVRACPKNCMSMAPQCTAPALSMQSKVMVKEVKEVPAEKQAEG